MKVAYRVSYVFEKPNGGLAAGVSWVSLPKEIETRAELLLVQELVEKDARSHGALVETNFVIIGLIRLPGDDEQ